MLAECMHVYSPLYPWQEMMFESVPSWRFLLMGRNISFSFIICEYLELKPLVHTNLNGIVLKWVFVFRRQWTGKLWMSSLKLIVVSKRLNGPNQELKLDWKCWKHFATRDSSILLQIEIIQLRVLWVTCHLGSMQVSM